jgi:hypothetical protein
VTVPGVEPPQGLPGFNAALNRVSAGYFRTMRIPLLRGRDIAPSDDALAPRVAVVNETMARRLWPASEPVGRSFFIPQGNRTLEFRVVGVAGDAQLRLPGQAAENFYYVPAAQWYNPSFVLHARVEPGREADAAAVLRRAVRDRPVAPLARAPDQQHRAYYMPQRLARG